MPENEYFKHYDGLEPFIFISYAHGNNDEVMRIITDMHSRGFRLWYDEGIEVGSEWQECIASHLMESDLMIAFISNAYIKSDNCRKEMAYALSKKKKIINIFLEETQLSPGMELQLGNIFAIMKYTYPSEGYFYTKLYDSEILADGDYGCDNITVNVTKKDEKAAVKLKRDKERKKREEEKKQEPKRKKKWLVPTIIILCVLAVIIAAGVVGYFTGYLERLTTQTIKVEALPGDTVAQFQNEVVELAAREYTGKKTGDITVAELTGLTSLYIVGNKYWFAEPGAGVEAEAVKTSAMMVDSKGKTITVERGSMTNLSDFAYFPSLSTLWIQFESISSLESLPACNVEELNIAGNRLSSLKGICNAPKLQTLVTDGCPLTDVETLNQCLDLRDVSMLSSNISDLSNFRPLVKFSSAIISNCTLSEVDPILNNGHLSSLTLVDCDLRGAFFTAFDNEGGMVSLTLENCQLDAIGDLRKFKNLAVLTIESCEGLPDYSQLTTLPALITLYIDSPMETSMAALMSTAAFKVVKQ